MSLGFKRPPCRCTARPRTSGCLLFARNHKARAGFSRRSSGPRSPRPIWPWLTVETPGEEGLIELPLAKVSSAAGGWRMVADDAGQVGCDALETAGDGGRAEPGRAPPLVWPHAPDPGPRGAWAGCGDCRRSRLQPARRCRAGWDDLARQRHAAPRLEAGHAPRAQRSDRRHRAGARPFGRWLDFFREAEDVRYGGCAEREFLAATGPAGRTSTSGTAVQLRVDVFS